MENIKELRKRNRAGSIDGAMLPDSQSDQAISTSDATECSDKRAPGPGLKHQASSAKQQASSESKPEPSSGSQASSDKL